MKKIITYAMLFFITTGAFGQQTNPGQPITRQDYLQRSKNQKTAAWALLAGGTALIGAGLLIGTKEEVSFNNAATSAIIIGVGVLSAIGSIPLFSASARNKRKAMYVSTYLELRHGPFQIKDASLFRSTPVLSLKLNF